MADENKHQATDESLPPSNPSKNISIIEPNHTATEGKQESGNNKPSETTASEGSRIMWATIVIAVATCIYVCFSGLQWCTMQRQLAEMQGGSRQTNDLIDKTKTLAENAGRQATNTETLANAAKDQVSGLKSLVATTNQQTEAMRRQLVMMQKQLELTDRPWIKVTLETTGPLYFFDNNTKFNVNFRITMKNVGRTVATKVRWADETFLLHNDPFDEPSERQKLILNRLSSTKPHSFEEGESIFPDEESVYSSSISTAVTVEADDFATRQGRPISNIVPWVVGCVEYQYASSTGRHYTCFSYTVRRLDPTIGVDKGVIHVGEDVPAQNVRLDSENWGGRFAD